MEEIVFVAADRTVAGKFGGMLAKAPTTELCAEVIREHLVLSGSSGEQLGEVILSQALQAGIAQNTARRSVIKAGLRQDVSAMKINKVCNSDSKAVMLAARATLDGDSDIATSGDQENASLPCNVLQDSHDEQRMRD